MVIKIEKMRPDLGKEQPHAVGGEPDLSKEHLYAVGVRIEGGGFTPVQSYATQEQLEKGFGEWYQTTSQRGITKPIAVEKESREQEWDGAQCFILRKLMETAINARNN